MTGSARGIGRGIALNLAECGVRRSGVHSLKGGAAAAETARLLRERGAEPVLLQADVTRADDIVRILAEARSALGSLDILVAYARPDVQHVCQPVLDPTAEHWRAAIASRATALLHRAREAVGMMGRGGRTIGVTYAPRQQDGTLAVLGVDGTREAAMEALLRYLAWDLAGRRITADAVSPGATDDSVVSTLPPEVLDASRGWAGAGWAPMGRPTTRADLGDAVALLCSEQAGFITGQTLSVDVGAPLAPADVPMAFQRCACLPAGRVAHVPDPRRPGDEPGRFSRSGAAPAGERRHDVAKSVLGAISASCCTSTERGIAGPRPRPRPRPRPWGRRPWARHPRRSRMILSRNEGRPGHPAHVVWRRVLGDRTPSWIASRERPSPAPSPWPPRRALRRPRPSTRHR